jgi:multidrug resistance efflux pump
VSPNEERQRLDRDAIDMFRKYLLPLMALAGLLFALRTVAQGARPVPVSEPVADPAAAPFTTTIAGAGIVEARGQNVMIGTPIAGIVAEVAVGVGDFVKAGTPLLRIDDRALKAQLGVERAALASAEAEVARLASLPREEDVPPAEARVAAAESALADWKEQLRLAEGLADTRAMSTEEWNRRNFNVKVGEARVSEMRADLLRLRAGAWAPELAVARAKAASAAAVVEAVEVELERLVVRAPTDCTVLQVNVRKGEFAPSGALMTPLMLVGDLSELHVRIDVDENDAWRLAEGAKARAYVRGNSQLSTDIEFVRIEPYVVPKRSLTGDSTERVDTRVLQAIYRFDPRNLRVYVGQQMDVFLEASESAGMHASAGGAGR